MIPEPDRADRFVDQAHAAIGNTGAPALQLGAYEGPLDLLLELARAQRSIWRSCPSPPSPRSSRRWWRRPSPAGRCRCPGWPSG